MSKHGLSIGLERVDKEFFLSLKAQGTLTHEDYETITPLIDAALSTVTKPKIKVLLDATELTGWEPRAAWDDFKIGLKHGSAFEKIAIYGNKDWQKIAAKIGSWFISGEIEYFANYDEAVEWLTSS